MRHIPSKLSMAIRFQVISFRDKRVAAHTLQLAIKDIFGEHLPQAELTAMIRRVCEVSSTNRKARPLVLLPHASWWNDTRWDIFYLINEHLMKNRFKIGEIVLNIKQLSWRQRVGVHFESD
jgi:hypothetical protein